MPLGRHMQLLWVYGPPAKLPKFDPAWKDKCLSCLHVSTVLTGSKCRDQSLVIRCKKASWSGGVPGPSDASAIGLRIEGGICGPEAKLWEKK